MHFMITVGLRTIIYIVLLLGHKIKFNPNLQIPLKNILRISVGRSAHYISDERTDAPTNNTLLPNITGKFVLTIKTYLCTRLYLGGCRKQANAF
jgi:hypothetical protein